MNDVVRAWKDASYRASLSADEIAALPANPAGRVEMDDAGLSEVNGLGTGIYLSLGCCPGFTYKSVCGSCGESCPAAACGTASYCHSYCAGTC